MTPALFYVLDANVFIEAANRYYAFDLAPAFWEALIEQARNSRLCSVDWVFDELQTLKDDLSQWAEGEFKKWFLSTKQKEIIVKYQEVINWVQSQAQYISTAKADFAKGADGWVVAYALVHSSVVVTQEQPSPAVKKRVPIPNVCKQFGVSFVDTFEMMRNLAMKLV